MGDGRGRAASPGPVADDDLAIPLVMAWAVVTGVGGSTAVIVFDLAREANPPERGGAATGVVNIGGFACAVICDLTIGWVRSAVGHGGRDALGYRPAMAVVPVSITFGLVQFWRLGRRHPALRRRGPVPSPAAGRAP